jgi:hypothetical protein
MTRNLPQRPQYSGNVHNALQTTQGSGAVAVPVATSQQGNSGGAPVEELKPVDHSVEVVNQSASVLSRTNASTYYDGGRFSGIYDHSKSSENGIRSSGSSENAYPPTCPEGDF